MCGRTALGEWEFLDRMHDLDAGVADQHVDAVPCAYHGDDGRVDLLLVGDVHRDRQRLAAFGGDLVRDRLSRRLVQIGDRDARALGGEAQRDFSTDAARGAGDNADLVTQRHS